MINQISIDTSETSVKHYTCATTDSISTFPVNCAKGSTMQVQVAGTGKTTATLVFDGTSWQYVDNKVTVADIVEIETVLPTDDEFIIDMKDKMIKNALIVLDYDIPQVETATIVGTITLAGNATITVTIAGVAEVISVPVKLGDTPAVVAGKIKTALNDNAVVSALYLASVDDDDVILTALTPTANDATLNIAYTNGTCTGLTPDASSTSTTSSGTNAKEISIVNIPIEGVVNLEIDYVVATTLTFNNTFVLDAPLDMVAGSKYKVTVETKDGGTTFIGKVDFSGAVAPTQLVLPFGTPVNAVAGSQTIELTDVGTDGKKITIGDVEYTLKTALSADPTVPNEILIAGTAGGTATNLKKAINHEATEGTQYSTGTVAHPKVTATINSATVTVTAKTKGIAGNDIELTTDDSVVTLGDDTLAGGVDGTVAKKGAIMVDADYFYCAVLDNTIADANWEKSAHS